MPQTLITSGPKIMMGKPTISGTRITVELILEKLGAGEAVDQILSEHPRLTAEAIRAAIFGQLWFIRWRTWQGENRRG